MRRAVEKWAAAVGLPDEVLDDLQYALGEAAANAVEHAYGSTGAGEFHYTLDHRPGPDGGVAVEVRDSGRWRPGAHRRRAPRAGSTGAARRREGRPHRGRRRRDDRDVPGTRAAGRRTAPAPRRAAPVRPSRHDVASPPCRRRPAGAAGDAATSTWTASPPSAPALLDALVPGGLVVDLHATGYVSSAGVALLVELATRAREQCVPLALRISAGSRVARVLELTGLRSSLPVEVC